MIQRCKGCFFLFVLSVTLAALAVGGNSAAAGGKSDTEVKVSVEGSKIDAGGKQEITVFLEINKGWHIYSNPVGSDELAGAQTEVKITAKTKLRDVKIDYPRGQVVEDKILGKYAVYHGKVTIKATVQRAEGDTGPLEVSVRFQACNDRGSCLFPATVRKTVP
ncbi:MAG: protein-disulfide reductase DsbD N-terminal domain-containing protein [Gemmataceae bacterium]|nr:protein-disulfide reductase DsbD N-terminal domain-containing protein [Gemmataceae bacterium]